MKSPARVKAIVAASVTIVGSIHAQSQPDARGKLPYEYVDPLIGTTNGGQTWKTTLIRTQVLTPLGHVFPGATLPFGMQYTPLLPLNS